MAHVFLMVLVALAILYSCYAIPAMVVVFVPIASLADYRRRQNHFTRLREDRAERRRFWVGYANEIGSPVSPIQGSARANKLPTMRFSEAMYGHPRRRICSCVICHEPYVYSEEIRRLPPCYHDFHANCIDPWFSNSSSCPLCRAEVEFGPDPPEVAQQFERLNNSRRQRADRVLRNLEAILDSEVPIQDVNFFYRVIGVVAVLADWIANTFYR